MGGDDRVSASMMWPGADQKYKGKKPFYIEPWDETVSYYDRVDKVSMFAVRWF